ncbi:MAG: aspartate kinase, partial [Saprospiraceae bacterium]|nr:aspartate kinase [Saprospiraceae bacterium]
MRVFKFGGASLKDSDGMKNVTSIIKSFPTTKLVVVVSATGKSTNLLEKVVYGYFHKTGEAEKYKEEFKSIHLEIASGLFEDSHPIFAHI